MTCDYCNREDCPGMEQPATGERSMLPSLRDVRECRKVMRAEVATLTEERDRLTGRVEHWQNRAMLRAREVDEARARVATLEAQRLTDAGDFARIAALCMIAEPMPDGTHVVDAARAVCGLLATARRFHSDENRNRVVLEARVATLEAERNALREFADPAQNVRDALSSLDDEDHAEALHALDALASRLTRVTADRDRLRGWADGDPIEWLPSQASPATSHFAQRGSVVVGSVDLVGTRWRWLPTIGTRWCWFPAVGQPATDTNLSPLYDTLDAAKAAVEEELRALDEKGTPMTNPYEALATALERIAARQGAHGRRDPGAQVTNGDCNMSECECPNIAALGHLIGCPSRRQTTEPLYLQIVHNEKRLIWQSYMIAALTKSGYADEAARQADHALAEDIKRFGEPETLPQPQRNYTCKHK